MGRVAGRAVDATREAILDAAATLIRRHGPHASLEDIAAQAGVSKGGLLYHFSTKDDLIVELTRDQLRRFRERVQARLEEEDATPGRLARAYVRTLLSPTEEPRDVRDAVMLISQLMTVPAAAELTRIDSLSLQRDLDGDGLPPHILTLVITSADGVCAAPIWGIESLDRRFRDLEARLIALTREPGLWRALA